MDVEYYVFELMNECTCRVVRHMGKSLHMQLVEPLRSPSGTQFRVLFAEQ
jgi:hypothetical protein